MSNSPLGRYAPLAAALACLGIVGAAVLVRVIRPEGDGFLEMLAVLAFGVLIGTPLGAAQGRAEGRAEGETAAVARINGALAQGSAANTRLDAIGAPSAGAATLQLQGAPAPIALSVPADPGDPPTPPAPARDISLRL